MRQIAGSCKTSDVFAGECVATSTNGIIVPRLMNYLWLLSDQDNELYLTSLSILITYLPVDVWILQREVTF